MEIYQIQHKPLPYNNKHSVLCEIPIFLNHMTKYYLHMYQKLNKVVCILKQCFLTHSKLKKSALRVLGFENFPIRTQSSNLSEMGLFYISIDRLSN